LVFQKGSEFLLNSYTFHETSITKSLLFLRGFSCQNSTTKFDELNVNFIENKELYKEVALFLEKKSEKYDFASLDISDHKIRLTLGNKGQQITTFLENKTLPSGVAQFLWKKKGILMKRACQRFCHSRKMMIKGRPKIIFPWVQTYQVVHLETNWFAYKINN